MFNYLKKEVDSNGWTLDIFGEWNILFLTFERNGEINLYNTIFNANIWIFIICITVLFIFIAFNEYIHESDALSLLKNISYFLIVMIILVTIISISIEFLFFETYNHLYSSYIINLIVIWIANIIVGLGLFLNEKMNSK